MTFSACAVMAGSETTCTLTSSLTPSLPEAAFFPIGFVPVPFLDHTLMTIPEVPEPSPRSLPTRA
jgi:hypothetical protein